MKKIIGIILGIGTVITIINTTMIIIHNNKMEQYKEYDDGKLVAEISQLERATKEQKNEIDNLKKLLQEKSNTISENTDTNTGKTTETAKLEKSVSVENNTKTDTVIKEIVNNSDLEKLQERVDKIEANNNAINTSVKMEELGIVQTGKEFLPTYLIKNGVLNTDYTLKSDDETIASIVTIGDRQGIKANKEGKCKITLTTLNNLSSTQELIVVDPKYKFKNKEQTVYLNDIGNFEIIDISEIEWSNSVIYRNDNKDNFTAVAEEDSIIKVQLNDRYYISYYKPTSVYYETLKIGTTMLYLKDANGNILDSMKILVKEYKEDTTEQTEELENENTNYYNINGIVSSTNKNELSVGDTLDLIVDYSPNTATIEGEWKSSDETIATVNQNGTVTGIKNGTVEITFVDKSGSEYSIQLQVAYTILGTIQLDRVIYNKDGIKVTANWFMYNNSGEANLRLTIQNNSTKNISMIYAMKNNNLLSGPGGNQGVTINNEYIHGGAISGTTYFGNTDLANIRIDQDWLRVHSIKRIESMKFYLHLWFDDDSEDVSDLIEFNF